MEKKRKKKGLIIIISYCTFKAIKMKRVNEKISTALHGNNDNFS